MLIKSQPYIQHHIHFRGRSSFLKASSTSTTTFPSSNAPGLGLSHGQMTFSRSSLAQCCSVSANPQDALVDVPAPAPGVIYFQQGESADMGDTSMLDVDDEVPEVAAALPRPRPSLDLAGGAQRDADPNSVSALGSTPIHIAVARREKPALLKKSRPYTARHAFSQRQ